jgi:5'-deoxynucleotidase YfbR-like HD superfamily hydrolase
MPDMNDKFDGDHARIRVSTGKYFHLFKDGGQEVDIMSIANALSRLCRYTGHLRDGIEIYSVAEHSVLVAAIVKAMGGSPQTQLAALLHDASEAYLADIAAPFKPHVTGYHEVEEQIMSRIRDKYLLPPDTHPYIKKADWYALFIEAPQILVDLDEDELATWAGAGEGHIEESKQYWTQVQCWLPSLAKMQFLAHFARLQDEIMEGNW